MSLSVIGSSVFLGRDFVGSEGIEFIPTNMDGESTNLYGNSFLIAKTPLINAHRNRINAHLLARGETHGSMALHHDGTAYVVGRGTKQDSQRVRRTPVLELDHDITSVLSIEHGIQFIPDSSLILADPHFATHPAVNMTWYEGASLAAALEDAVKGEFPGMRIRMMHFQEARRFITWDGKYTADQVKARAHLYRDGVTGTASVTDAAATLRTTPEGFVDPFGNVWIWTESVLVPPIPYPAPDMIDTVSRMLCGASWRDIARTASVTFCDAMYPDKPGHEDGVRFVTFLR